MQRNSTQLLHPLVFSRSLSSLLFRPSPARWLSRSLALALSRSLLLSLNLNLALSLSPSALCLSVSPSLCLSLSLSVSLSLSPLSLAIALESPSKGALPGLDLLICPCSGLQLLGCFEALEPRFLLMSVAQPPVSNVLFRSVRGRTGRGVLVVFFATRLFR